MKILLIVFALLAVASCSRKTATTTWGKFHDENIYFGDQGKFSFGIDSCSSSDTLKKK